MIADHFDPWTSFWSSHSTEIVSSFTSSIIADRFDPWTSFGVVTQLKMFRRSLTSSMIADRFDPWTSFRVVTQLKLFRRSLLQ